MVKMSWSKDLKQNIIGIPLVANTPHWDSSPPRPEQQLAQLGAHPMGPFVSEFKDYEKDPGLSKLVKGKRIAYVCPSPHLQGQGMGELIDSYDLVVRVNQGYASPESNWEDYGKRTDILMNCLNINKMRALELEFAKTLKYIVCPMVSMWDIRMAESFLDNIGTPWHNVCDGYLFKVFKEVGTTCNTGLMGLITLLNYDIEELYLTGMTFFNMNNFGKVYSDKYYDEALKGNNFGHTENREPTISDLRIDIHKQQPQINYFHKIIAFHYMRKLKLDDYLLENFSKSVKFVESKYKGKK